MSKMIQSALENMEIPEQQAKDLHTAIWSNFENFDIIGHVNVISADESIMTQSGRIYKKENFINAYQSGQMDIEDLIYVFF